jgi:plasmid stabilization system protein ParE
MPTLGDLSKSSYNSVSASAMRLAPGLRMAALGSYVIFFSVSERKVRIERVLHGARNLPAVLESDQKFK